ncbi:hypothetical protein GGTG_14125 [Gaeumannomyces tritici R3-111a-1]|uniref:Uncharacterized protein n=1 Tax=Gaeumannomyces tritici (strain R3-111a-1) TaxID=644352 RepID=J3PKR0_GAET3|nr:hypothetical protein GGTG_14125 [Gaeumannomyces tritici R3-111a-1]EJT68292.1 hypothetical protein GGTG_14125 [Gaeumannomyces tritici R3-111a-1]
MGGDSLHGTSAAQHNRGNHIGVESAIGFTALAGQRIVSGDGFVLACCLRF